MSRCSLGCDALIEEGDGHDVCLTCLGLQHAEAAFVDTSCPHCGKMPIQTLRSRVAVFFMGKATTSSVTRSVTAVTTALPPVSVNTGGDMGITVNVRPPATGSRTVHAPSRLSDHPLRDGPTPSCSSATYSGVRDEDEMSIAASEGDLLASDPDDSSELPPPGGRAQEEADVEMSTMLFRAAASIGLQCTAPPLPQRSRLDTWYLGSERGSKPRPAPVPYFPEVHEELSKTWNAPLTARSNQKGSVALTSLDGGAARGYVEIPQVERAVAVHLCPQTAATWRARPRLPSKACKFSASLVSKAYTAAGQAASSLHAMAILQVHQAKALKELHEGKTDPTVMQELRTATDLALRATKVTARALGRAMSTMVVQERHLWLNLAQMRDAEKVRFLDAPISQGGL
ncbi:uncharacterized protein LOC130558871 [Triplophysa rosa]|uniref:uncharacterized protein LOC130558871 n=1 Tax=Triplophysa rosa TaxID=992332 RepID=UPI00254610F4|nr:uncharacterized protein LOC130558871 [Triplophysa rosa]